MVVDHDDEVFTQQQRRSKTGKNNSSTMQPLVSAGKLFEPKIRDLRDDRPSTNDDVLEPTYERQRDGPRITLNNEEDDGKL